MSGAAPKPPAEADLAANASKLKKTSAAVNEAEKAKAEAAKKAYLEDQQAKKEGKSVE